MTDSSTRFEERYREADLEDLPWYHPEPDADLMELLRREGPAEPTEAVDLGAGPAVFAVYMAGLGHRVTAVDAIDRARELGLRVAQQHGAEIDYQVHDVLTWEAPQSYGIVFDRGFMHTLEPAQRSRWRERVLATLRPGGLLLCKCFDVHPPREFGPRGLSAADVVATLGPPEPGGLELRALLHTRFPGELGEHATWSIAARRIA